MKGWFANRYGSRRGFALTFWHQFLYSIGKYRAYRKVDWESVERLVFVCKGNICRSAYAESVAKSLNIQTISCGVDTRNGSPANSDAIQVAKARGKNLSKHKTTSLNELSLRKGDLLVAMEPWQAKHLESELGSGCKSTLLGIWSVSKRPYIQDPYGASTAYFNNCFSFIEKSVHEITYKIRK
jgi:protein-tyrosine phosphatase